MVMDVEKNYLYYIPKHWKELKNNDLGAITL